MANDLKAATERYAAAHSHENLELLCTAFGSETNPRAVVDATRILARVKASQDSTRLLQEMISLFERLGPDSLKHGACDAVYNLGHLGKQHRDVALLGLEWIRQCAPKLGPLHADILIKSGLVRLTLEFGELHIKEEEVVKECVSTLVSLIECGSKSTFRQLRLMGLSDLLVDARHHYPQQEAIQRDICGIQESIKLNQPPKAKGIWAMFCLAVLSSEGAI